MTELEYFKGDELAASTWRNKYAAEGEQTPDDTHKRLAKEFARVESNYNWKSNIDRAFSNLSNYGYVRPQLDEEAIYQLFKDFKYIIPGGSVMSGCGTGALVSLSNCFVIGSPKDSYAELMKTRSQQAQLMKRRGGVGYDLSQLRPRGAKVNNAAKSSTGAASFMDVCSDITNEVAQNGRRGALMLSMSINHPDIEEFITKKQDLTKVTGANISVKVTDEFMQAVVNNEDYVLRYPVDFNVDVETLKEFLSLNEMEYNYNELYSIKIGETVEGSTTHYFKPIKARELWNTLMHCAWNTAEPGIMFESQMHNYSPDGVYEDFRMVSTNPCGSQFCCK
jgi:ribonucleoside-diphosphate reductase alpha chain